jgi:hypothetical protein
MVMEAHGLYMLAFPRRFYDEAVAPLTASMERFHEDSLQLLTQQANGNRATLEASEKARQTAKAAAASMEKLEEAIRSGWREVNTAELSQKIENEVEQTLLRPLSVQCRQLEEEVAPAITKAATELEESARKLRIFHFRGILLCLVMMFAAITGGYAWYLKQEHDRELWSAARRLETTASHNREAFQQLDLLGAKIRVRHPVDERGRPAKDQFVLVMDAGYEVVVMDSQKGKWAGIYFRRLNDDERREKNAP